MRGGGGARTEGMAGTLGGTRQQAGYRQPLRATPGHTHRGATLGLERRAAGSLTLVQRLKLAVERKRGAAPGWQHLRLGALAVLGRQVPVIILDLLDELAKAHGHGVAAAQAGERAAERRG